MTNCNIEKTGRTLFCLVQNPIATCACERASVFFGGQDFSQRWVVEHLAQKIQPGVRYLGMGYVQCFWVVGTWILQRIALLQDKRARSVHQFRAVLSGRFAAICACRAGHWRRRCPCLRPCAARFCWRPRLSLEAPAFSLDPDRHALVLARDSYPVYPIRYVSR